MSLNKKIPNQPTNIYGQIYMRNQQILHPTLQNIDIWQQDQNNHQNTSHNIQNRNESSLNSNQNPNIHLIEQQEQSSKQSQERSLKKSQNQSQEQSWWNKLKKKAKNSKVLFLFNMIFTLGVPVENIILFFFAAAEYQQIYLTITIAIILLFFSIHSIVSAHSKEQYFWKILKPDSLFLTQLAGTGGYIGLNLVYYQETWLQLYAMIGVSLIQLFLCVNSRYILKYQISFWYAFSYSIVLVIGGLIFFAIGCYVIFKDYQLTDGVDQKVDSAFKDFILLYVFGNFAFYVQLLNRAVERFVRNQEEQKKDEQMKQKIQTQVNKRVQKVKQDMQKQLTEKIYKQIMEKLNKQRRQQEVILRNELNGQQTRYKMMRIKSYKRQQLMSQRQNQSIDSQKFKIKLQSNEEQEQNRQGSPQVLLQKRKDPNTQNIIKIKEFNMNKEKQNMNKYQQQGKKNKRNKKGKQNKYKS